MGTFSSFEETMGPVLGFWANWKRHSVLFHHFGSSVVHQSKGLCDLGTASIIYNPVYNSGGLPHACFLLLVHEHHLSSSGRQLNR